MAWVTPVTNRTSMYARMTYTDMNRISGNVSYLYNYALEHGYAVAGGDVDKTEYTQNDIVTEQNWNSLQSVLTAVRNAIGLNRALGALTSYTGANLFEQFTLDTYMHVADPSEYGLLQNREGIQIQTENNIDLEAGIL